MIWDFWISNIYIQANTYPFCTWLTLITFNTFPVQPLGSVFRFVFVVVVVVFCS